MGQNSSTPAKVKTSEPQTDDNISRDKNSKQIEVQEQQSISKIENHIQFANSLPNLWRRDNEPLYYTRDQFVERRNPSIFQYSNTIPDINLFQSPYTTPAKTPFRFVKTADHTPGGDQPLKDSQDWVKNTLEKKKAPNRLSVQEFNVGDSCVILSINKLAQLGISKGGHVLVTGKKGHKVLCIVIENETISDEKIGMNKLLRDNLKIEIGEFVTIHKQTRVPELTKIYIAPVAETVEGLNLPLKSTDLNTYFREKYRPVTEKQTFNFTKSGRLIELQVLNVEPSPNEFGIVGARTELSLIKPIQRDEASLDDIGYEDIGGYKEQIAILKETIEHPLKQPKLFHSIGVNMPKGVLLYGPKGCGKKLLARAVACESGKARFTINGLDFISKPIEKLRKDLDETFKLARNYAPSIIIIDGIDLFINDQEDTPSQKKAASKLIALMDGLSKTENIFCIGIVHNMINFKDTLRAFKIFNRTVFLGLPDEQARFEILKIHARKTKLSDEALQEIAKETEGFTGLDLEKLCTEASLQCIREKSHIIDFDAERIEEPVLNELIISKRHFQAALDTMKTSLLIGNQTPFEESKSVIQQATTPQLLTPKPGKGTPKQSLKRLGDKLQRELEEAEESFEPTSAKKIKSDEENQSNT